LNRSGNVPKTLKIVFDESIYDEWHEDCTARGSQCKLWAAPVAKVLTFGPSLQHLALELEGIKCFEHIVRALEPCKVGTEQRPWDTVRTFTLGLRKDCNEPPTPSESVYKHLPPSVTYFHLTLQNAWEFVGDDDAWDPQRFVFYSMPLHIPPNFVEKLTTFFISCN
jgi:hypothetical protein